MSIGRAVAVVGGVCLLVACGRVGPYEAPPLRAESAGRRLVLPSGLTVFIDEDASIPVAGVVWSVRCGSAQDPVGREGLAHAVEHLVFRAPAGTGIAKHERLLRLGAADLNGETDFDATTYHTFVHEGAAAALLDVELASMTDPLAGIDEASFAVEMGVVREELDFHDLPGAGRQGQQALERALFPAHHPYTRPVGGSDASLAAITLADARAFARSCYQPRNMALVVSGAIAPGWLDRFLARLPGALRGDPAHPQPPHLPGPPARGTYASPRPAFTELTAPVTMPELWVGWPLPPAVGADAASLLVLRRLVQALISNGLSEEGDADNPQLESGRIAVSTNAGRFGGFIACRAHLPAGGHPRREADAIIERIAGLWQLLNENQSWFERTRAQATAEAALDAGDVVNRALVEARLLTVDTKARPDAILRRVDGVSFSEALGWARNQLQREQARVVIVRPSAIKPRTTPRAARVGFHGAVDAPGDLVIPAGFSVTDVARPVGASRAVTRRLPTGLLVTVLRRPGAPQTDFVLGFHASPEPREDAAVRAAFLSAQELWYFRRPSELGIAHRLHVDRDSLREEVEILAGREDQALAYLGRVIGGVTIEWPSDRFQQSATVRRTEEELPVPRAERAFWSTLWHGHSYGAKALVGDVERVKASEIEGWLDRVRRPANGTLIVVGDVDPDHVFARVEAELGGWGKRGPGPGAITPPPALQTGGALRVTLESAPARPAATLELGCLVPPVADEGQRTVNDLLARFLDDRLRETLRLQAGASYAQHVRANDYRGGAAAIEAWADVQSSALPFAVGVVKGLMSPDAPMPFDAAALERLRWAAARDSNLRYRTSRDLARALFDSWNMGWQPASLDELPARLAAVTLPDLARALRTCRANAVLTIIGDTRALSPPSPYPGS